MKKAVFGFVAVFVLVGFIIGCDNGSGSGGTKTDPGVDFTGTWVGTGQNVDYVKHIISGRNGIFYQKTIADWQESAIYTIEWDGSKYISSTQWIMRIDNGILTVQNMTYTKTN
jgi:hypothetical protein